MKDAHIPSVRIDSALRETMVQSLHEGESLAALVETAVRREIQRRQTQTDFLRRGLAAIERTIAADDGIPADAVIARLQNRLTAAQRDRRP